MGRRFSDDLNEFLSKYAFWICLALVILIALVIVIILVSGKKKGKSKEVNKSSDWLLALGDKENILEVSGSGSRLSIKLANKELVNRDKLTELGVSSVVSMSGKLTLVIEDKAEKIAQLLSDELAK